MLTLTSTQYCISILQYNIDKLPVLYQVNQVVYYEKHPVVFYNAVICHGVNYHAVQCNILQYNAVVLHYSERCYSAMHWIEVQGGGRAMTSAESGRENNLLSLTATSSHPPKPAKK